MLRSQKISAACFLETGCHPKMAMVIDDKVAGLEKREPPRVHVLLHILHTMPHRLRWQMLFQCFELQEMLLAMFVVASSEFGDNLLRKVFELMHKNELLDLPFAPDVGDYLNCKVGGVVPSPRHPMVSPTLARTPPSTMPQRPAPAQFEVGNQETSVNGSEMSVTGPSEAGSTVTSLVSPKQPAASASDAKHHTPLFFAQCRKRPTLLQQRPTLQHGCRKVVKQMRTLRSTRSFSTQVQPVTVSLDGSVDERLHSYEMGVLAFRRYCYLRGKCVDVSQVFDCSSKCPPTFFTTPTCGSFYLRLIYMGRQLEVVHRGYDLYSVGWENAFGAYEIRPGNKPSYMVGAVTCLDFNYDYRSLSPMLKVVEAGTVIEPDLCNIVIEAEALRKAFTVLVNCNGEVSELVKQAVGTIVVYFPEASRFQVLYNALKKSFSYPKPRLISQVWSDIKVVQHYRHYSHELMAHVDMLLKGDTPTKLVTRHPVIRNHLDIALNIRILLQSACMEGYFEPHPALYDPCIEIPSDPLHVQVNDCEFLLDDWKWRYR